MIASGELSSGHDPEGRRRASTRCDAGVERAHILNGTVPHALLLEVYTDAGVGTMITRDGGTARRRRR